MRGAGAFPTFPRHGCCYLFVFKHDICCTWNLNVPAHFFLSTHFFF
jgi:hypothetical protein